MRLSEPSGRTDCRRRWCGVTWNLVFLCGVGIAILVGILT
jgi:hypothetical protein